MRYETRAQAVALVALLLLSSCEKRPGLEVGDMAPEFSLPSLDGTVMSLSDWQGQVVVLNYWATWCPPCVQEMPSLQELHEALGEQGLRVVAVSVDERFSDIQGFVDRFDLSFIILHDEGMKTARRYQTFKYPETYIIDRSGRVKSKVVGERNWIAPSVIRDLVRLLKESPQAPPAGSSGHSPSD